MVQHASTIEKFVICCLTIGNQAGFIFHGERKERLNRRLGGSVTNKTWCSLLLSISFKSLLSSKTTGIFCLNSN